MRTTNYALEEIIYSYTDYPLYNVPYGLIMDKYLWDSLPIEYQDIIDSFSGYDGSMAMASRLIEAAEYPRHILAAAGLGVSYLTNDAIAEFQIEATHYAISWAEEVNDMGLLRTDARDYLARAKEYARW